MKQKEYQIDVPIWATVYVTADSEAEAIDKLTKLLGAPRDKPGEGRCDGCSIFFTDDDRNIPQEIPGTSLSCVATAYGFKPDMIQCDEVEEDE